MITIQSKPFSLSSKKYVFVNGEELYTAKTDSFAGENQFKLIDLKSGFVKTIITNEIAFFKHIFNIRILNNDNVKLVFRRKSIFNSTYTGYYFDDKYELFISRFKKHSIFKNDNLIAVFHESNSFYEEVSDFEIYNSEEKDFELIITICLFIHVHESSKEK